MLRMEAGEGLFCSEGGWASMATARARHSDTRYAASTRIVVAGLAPAMQQQDAHLHNGGG